MRPPVSSRRSTPHPRPVCACLCRTWQTGAATHRQVRSGPGYNSYTSNACPFSCIAQHISLQRLDSRPQRTPGRSPHSALNRDAILVPETSQMFVPPRLSLPNDRSIPICVSGSKIQEQVGIPPFGLRDPFYGELAISASLTAKKLFTQSRLPFEMLGVQSIPDS